MPLRTALEHILELRCQHGVVDPYDHLQHRDTVLKAIAAAPQGQHTFCYRWQIPLDDGCLEAEEKCDRWRINQQLNGLLANRVARRGGRTKCLTDQGKLARVPQTETRHECDGVLRNMGHQVGRLLAEERGAVFREGHGITLKHHTAALNGFNEVIGALGDEDETGLVGVEFQDTAEGLLGYHGQIVGIIEEDPGSGIWHGAHAAHEFCQALTDGSDTTIIRATQAKGHIGLVRGIRDTLGGQLLRHPRVGQHRFADAGGSPEENMRRILDAGAEEPRNVILAQDGVLTPYLSYFH